MWRPVSASCTDRFTVLRPPSFGHGPTFSRARVAASVPAASACTNSTWCNCPHCQRAGSGPARCSSSAQAAARLRSSSASRRPMAPTLKAPAGCSSAASSASSSVLRSSAAAARGNTAWRKASGRWRVHQRSNSAAAPESALKRRCQASSRRCAAWACMSLKRSGRSRACRRRAGTESTSFCRRRASSTLLSGWAASTSARRSWRALEGHSSPGGCITQGPAGGRLYSLALANQPAAGLRSAGSSVAGRKPAHSKRPSPGTGSRPSQFGRRGMRPATAHAISPAVSA